MPSPQEIPGKELGFSGVASPLSYGSQAWKQGAGDAGGSGEVTFVLGHRKE
jgi:hypothetical protein